MRLQPTSSQKSSHIFYLESTSLAMAPKCRSRSTFTRTGSRLWRVPRMRHYCMPWGLSRCVGPRWLCCTAKASLLEFDSRHQQYMSSCTTSRCRITSVTIGQPGTRSTLFFRGFARPVLEPGPHRLREVRLIALPIWAEKESHYAADSDSQTRVIY